MNTTQQNNFEVFQTVFGYDDESVGVEDERADSYEGRVWQLINSIEEVARDGNLLSHRLKTRLVG